MMVMIVAENHIRIPRKYILVDDDDDDDDKSSHGCVSNVKQALSSGFGLPKETLSRVLSGSRLSSQLWVRYVILCCLRRLALYCTYGQQVFS